MKKLFMTAFIAAGLIASTNALHAQALTADAVKETMVKEWTRAKAYTGEYLSTMPADKYSFKATDSVRSFAQQMLHITGGNMFLISMATGAQMPAWAQRDLEHTASAASKDSVAYFVNMSYDFCIEAVSNLPADKWGENVKTRFGTEATRYALILKTFEHQTHHRGQTTIYIRLAGIKPPNEKLF